jgi:cyclopropane fatty-acyl-phospholipid synthase-like methyltransferase
MELSFSQACENNKKSILSVLKNAFCTTNKVLEVGSGTGQHAVFFAENLPHLSWQPSDLLANHYSINYRKEQSALTNLLTPITLDLNQSWSAVVNSSPLDKIDGIFTANTLHIVSNSLVEKFFIGVRKTLTKGGTLCIYGPFHYQGEYTSESNRNFDLWLKNRDEESAIRDFERIVSLAQVVGLSLLADNIMPANNRLLVFVMN